MGDKTLQMFSDATRDHGMTFRNRGSLQRFDGHARITGPCGDTIEIWIIIEHGRVRYARFETDGCCSSLACGSMACTLASGRRLEDAEGLNPKEILEALGGLPQESAHCALLAADTLSAACRDYLERLRSSRNAALHQGRSQNKVPGKPETRS